MANNKEPNKTPNDFSTNEWGDPISLECARDMCEDCEWEDCNCACHSAEPPDDEDSELYGQ